MLVADDGDHETADLADHVLWVPAGRALLSPVVDVVPLQLLAYRLARPTASTWTGPGTWPRR